MKKMNDYVFQQHFTYPEQNAGSFSNLKNVIFLNYVIFFV